MVGRLAALICLLDLSTVAGFKGPGRRAALAGGFAALAMARQASAADPPKFKRLSPIQFIAALGDPEASAGTGADKWGLWREDPGPRGVWLKDYEKKLVAAKGKAPAGWTFEPKGWWVEEHGLIMETPAPLPLQKYAREGEGLRVVEPAKRYVVTGDRDVTAVLTVHNDGRWELSKGRLFDVTHLPCRSAVYTPAPGGATGSCSPAEASMRDFPVKPGALMPEVPNCKKQDWAVLFVVGVEA